MFCPKTCRRWDILYGTPKIYMDRTIISVVRPEGFLQPCATFCDTFNTDVSSDSHSYYSKLQLSTFPKVLLNNTLANKQLECVPLSSDNYALPCFPYLCCTYKDIGATTTSTQCPKECRHTISEP